MTIRASLSAVLVWTLLAASLAGCSLNAPRQAAPPPPPATRTAPVPTRPAATPPPTRALPSATPAKPTLTRPAPTALPAVPQTIEMRDFAVLSPANITHLQLLASFRPGPQGALGPMLFSPDHTRLIFGLAAANPEAGSTPVYIWSLAAGLPDHILAGNGLGRPVLAFSADPSTLALAGTGALQLWATRDWQPLPAPPEAYSPTAALDFAPTAAWLAVGTQAGLLGVWDTSAAQETWSAQAHEVGLSALAVSPTGAWVVTAGLDGALRLWNAQDGKKERDLAQSAGVITALAFLPDDQQVIDYAKDGQVRIWRISDGHQAAQFQACSSGLPGCTPPAFSPDRRLMALGDPAAQDGPGIYIWDLQTHTAWPAVNTAPLLDPTRISALAFSADGRLLAAGSEDGLIQIWGIPGTPFLQDAQLRVTESGDGANLRDRPALEGSIRSQLSTGETLRLLEGPVLAGGFDWGRVLTADGREGWIVEVPEWYETGGP
ncbi:MAG TPA: SH3 domain-containing protein [Anaerolinea sp.]|nr:SH3 domain-containing protein [Anaerolinea sp.]